MKDHFVLQKVRLPLEQLFKGSMPMPEKSKELYYRSSATDRFYLQSGQE